jgi:hypothetical protein
MLYFLKERTEIAQQLSIMEQRHRTVVNNAKGLLWLAKKYRYQNAAEKVDLTKITELAEKTFTAAENAVGRLDDLEYTFKNIRSYIDNALLYADDLTEAIKEV